MKQARAEFDSLSQWLTDSLSDDELRHIGLISLNQWPFVCAIVGEIALTAHAMGSGVTVGMWADDTPLPDPGWTTSRTLARLTGSKSIDQRLEQGLVAAGLPSASIQRPPLRPWRPVNLPAVPERPTRSEIRALTYHGPGMGRSLLQVHPDDNTPIRDDHRWPTRYTERAAKSYAWVYDQVTELIHRRGITALVVFNGRFTHDQAAAAAALAAGIRVLYYDAGGLETGFDLTFTTTHDWDHLQERMLRMWQEWPEPERSTVGTTWFMNRQEHKEPGLKAFVEFQQRGNLDGVPKADTLVAFFSSSPDEIVELDLDWDLYFGSQPEALAALADAVRATPGAELVVRTHPHMRLKPEQDLIDWRSSVLAAEPAAHYDAADPLDSYALMRAADIVVTYGSTSGVEAAFMNRPVVVMGPSAYNLLGCVTQAKTAEQMLDLLNNPPTLSQEMSLPYGLMMMRRGFNFTHVSKDSDGRFQIGGVTLTDASEWARKVGDYRKQRTFARLLAH